MSKVVLNARWEKMSLSRDYPEQEDRYRLFLGTTEAASNITPSLMAACRENIEAKIKGMSPDLEIQWPDHPMTPNHTTTANSEEVGG